MNRLEFLQMLGVGGLVFATGLPGFGSGPTAVGEEFLFAQLTDTHWGFEGPKANPDAAGTLPKAIAAVNGLARQPDFVIFTGDLTHTTDDPDQRRERMAAFKAHASRLRVPKVLYLPGEHDASLDAGEAYREAFGPSRYAFTHKGLHCIALDNVSQEGSTLGKVQLQWFAAEVAKVPRDSPLVIFAHRPLFDLYPDWDWHTADGGEALALLKDHRFVTVFYGHIHQEHHHATGHILHHAATSLIFPLPAPGSQPKRAPVPWDPEHPYRGLGFREVNTRMAGGGASRTQIIEEPLASFLPAPVGQP
jgi:hypothetical protein